MTIHEADQELLLRLRRLRVAEPDAGRRERIRARWHAAVLQRREQAERRRKRSRFVARVLEPVLVGGLSASYLLAILFVLLGLRGML